MKNKIIVWKMRAMNFDWASARRKVLAVEPGIDGILVTVGLCIIALLLCVVMKDSLTTFITTLVGSMTSKAQNILTGVAG